MKKLNYSDLDLLENWTKHKKGMCNGCWGTCCTLPVEVSAFDLIRLELITEEEAAISLKDVAKKLLKKKIIQSFQPKNQLFVLAQQAGRDCIFLDSKTRLCTVYSKRPNVCRLFPKIGPKPGFCPAFYVGKKVEKPPVRPKKLT